MLKKSDKIQNEMILNTLEELVPKDHLVRKLDQIDYTFIYDEVKNLYSNDGRPSIDPVVLFKIILIKNLFFIKSIRQTLKEIEVNIAYRWFLNISFSEKVPHYSVISSTFNNRFTENILNKIFKRIIQNAVKHQLISDKELSFLKLKYKLKKNKLTNKVSIETDEKNLYETTLV